VYHIIWGYTKVWQQH